ncbi:MAG: two-component system response regulator [Spirochaetes bacterium RBG_13_68_11]|nr:MAG: two-component system response regulator [Spirochaetes bacterium RBG_13_68_11]
MTREEAGKTILLADDEPGILMLLKTLCEDMGYRTIEASNGLVAVEKATRLSPDLAIMDGAMPVKSGFEAIRELKANLLTEHIPIIMLTGLQTREDRLKGISAGANDFLTKPVDAEELALRVRNNLKIKEYHDFLKNHAEILEEQVRERTMELRKTLDELKQASDLVTRGYIDTIFRLAVVSEYKDEDTGSHIKRISYYSKELASALGMDADFMDGIFHASIMHDIGKVGIPDSILLKPGALSPEEWETMKSHTERGARILSGSDSPYLKMAEQIARCHHERWDGSGYLSGLSGEAIPLAARITNIADQYDALRTRRPYKPAFSHSDTVRVITEGDGRTMPRHFDPRVLQCFSASAGRFEEIYEEKKDE